MQLFPESGPGSDCLHLGSLPSLQGPISPGSPLVLYESVHFHHLILKFVKRKSGAKGHRQPLSSLLSFLFSPHPAVNHLTHSQAITYSWPRAFCLSPTASGYLGWSFHKNIVAFLSVSSQEKRKPCCSPEPSEVAHTAQRATCPVWLMAMRTAAAEAKHEAIPDADVINKSFC